MPEIWPSPDALRDLEVRDPEIASLWHEARADALLGAEELEQGRFALSAASRHATGVRRATLLRRLADAQLLAGQPDAAMVTLQPLGRNVAPTPLATEAAASAAFAALRQRRPACDDWQKLSAAAALAFVELTRAEALSHLIKHDDALRAFAEVERRAKSLDEAAAATLWVRWARAQTWFLCEILGDAAAALEICRRVRSHVSAAALADEAHAIALLRAEEVASSSVGDYARGRALVEEQIAIAVRQGNRREECLAWNARALLHFGEGELASARRALERARELAIATKWSRREAIGTHNLSLLLCEQLELDEAERLERRYGELSIAIGNLAGKVEAPLVLAAIELARGALPQANQLLGLARRDAESSGWVMLLAQARALSGRLQLQEYVMHRDTLALPRARADLLAALDTLEEHSTAWTEELDPGETYALLAFAEAREGRADRARDTLAKGRKRVPPQCVVSHRALELGTAAAAGQPITDALKWFDAHGFKRLVALWKLLAG